MTQPERHVLSIPSGAARTWQPLRAEAGSRGDVPTTGLMRPGPVGLNPEPVRRKGVAPVAMTILQAGVDAQVEKAEIIQGKMTEPSGPYVVAWYSDTGKIGQGTNMVFAGHLDYYEVGEAVFFHLTDLAEGDMILLTGDDGEPYSFRTEWIKTYTQDELDTETVKGIVATTDTESVTLITCSGPFDFDNGIYHDRTVVRGNRID
ncbi:MAG TPA: class F sortase [Thermomicrobiales bacterium]|nr:class F sortase [Thermomicrobiales bacterium]